MSGIKILHAPIINQELNPLKAGDAVYLTGTIFTARDAAHKRIFKMIKEGKPIPVDLKNQVIYYTGPSPAKPGQVIGSCGPTTSSRMDVYTPTVVGKGPESDDRKGTTLPGGN